MREEGEEGGEREEGRRRLKDAWTRDVSSVDDEREEEGERKEERERDKMLQYIERYVLETLSSLSLPSYNSSSVSFSPDFELSCFLIEWIGPFLTPLPSSLSSPLPSLSRFLAKLRGHCIHLLSKNMPMVNPSSLSFFLSFFFFLLFPLPNPTAYHLSFCCLAC